MMDLDLWITLKSDATFGRGDGVAGLIDEEVEYDRTTGLPFIRGRVVKGLLWDECANLLALFPGSTTLADAARFLFGRSGSSPGDAGLMHVSPARLPADLCAVVQNGLNDGALTPDQVLQSLTDVRRQTSVDERTGAPEENSLRSMRVVVRNTAFVSRLNFRRDPDGAALALLAACVLAVRRGGTGRNRGRGRLSAVLVDDAFTAGQFKRFQQLLKGGAA
ncbi:MAG: hypothetical protein M1546_23870 [Chloroflexi bacterium]|nr:hypothetical protein [Chloroflexota bacterium]